MCMSSHVLYEYLATCDNRNLASVIHADSKLLCLLRSLANFTKPAFIWSRLREANKGACFSFKASLSFHPGRFGQFRNAEKSVRKMSSSSDHFEFTFNRCCHLVFSATFAVTVAFTIWLEVGVGFRVVTWTPVWPCWTGLWDDVVHLYLQTTRIWTGLLNMNFKYRPGLQSIGSRVRAIGCWSRLGHIVLFIVRLLEERWWKF